jgi:hypothetical protein
MGYFRGYFRKNHTTAAVRPASLAGRILWAMGSIPWLDADFSSRTRVQLVFVGPSRNSWIVLATARAGEVW